MSHIAELVIPPVLSQAFCLLLFKLFAHWPIGFYKDRLTDNCFVVVVFSPPFLISLMVSVDVKHHVYLLIGF